MIIPNTNLISAHLTAIAAALNAGSAGGRMRAYSAPQPAAGAAITTQVLIGTATLAKPCGTVSGNTLTFTNPGPLVIGANGTIAWVRFEDSDGNWVADGTAGLTNSTADVRIGRLDVQSGGYIDWTAASLTYPTS